MLKRQYGITLKEYNKMLKKQGGVCKLCRAKKNRRALSVDHYHKTGKVRGILCHHCNLALGGFKDNIKVMRKAIKYLEKNGKKK